MFSADNQQGRFVRFIGEILFIQRSERRCNLIGAFPAYRGHPPLRDYSKLTLEEAREIEQNFKGAIAFWVFIISFVVTSIVIA